MAEYIDREAAIKAVNWQSAITMTRAAMTYAIKSIPAADVVEVVRCKDCKHRWKGDCGLWCMIHDDMYAEEDYFCASGERREAGT